MLTGLYFSISMGRLIWENEVRQAQANVDRIENALSETLGKAVDIANRAYVNGQIHQVVETEYQTPLEVYAAYSGVAFFDNYLRAHNEIAGIRLYVENPTMLNNSYFTRADPDVKQEEWYRKAESLGGKMFWTYRRDSILRSNCLSLVRQIRNANTGSRIGVLCVNIDTGKLSRLCLEAPHEAAIALDGKTIAASDDGFAPKIRAPKNYVFTNSYVLHPAKDEFQISYSIPKKTLFAPVYSIFKKSLIIVFGTLAFALGTIFRIVNEVYIEKLQKEMLFSRQKEMQLKILSSQINPHFLYNTLETIRMMALSKGEEEISATIKMLSRILRQSLSSAQGTVPLETELERVRDYLGIQKLRFGERINFSIDVEEETKPLMERIYILPLLIQPLVENSFVHGLEKKDGRARGEGRVLIRVKVQGESLVVEVTDNGAGLDAEGMERVREELGRSLDAQTVCGGERIGLANVNQRIKLFYGADYGLELSPSPNGGLSVRMRVSTAPDVQVRRAID
jgi:two-component system sensor histidine kinase YesM